MSSGRTERLTEYHIGLCRKEIPFGKRSLSLSERTHYHVDLSWADDHMTVFKRMGLDSLTWKSPCLMVFIILQKPIRVHPVPVKDYYENDVKRIIPPETTIKLTTSERHRPNEHCTMIPGLTRISLSMSAYIGEIRILKKIVTRNDF